MLLAIDVGNSNTSVGLFDLDMPQQEESAINVPDLPELDRQTKMMMEREVTGLYLSGHPMDELAPLAREVGAVYNAQETEK